MQDDAALNWKYTADAGKHAGRGLFNRTVSLAQGRMLGGSSGINLMVYVRGHPGDFNRWAEDGAAGWSYDEVLPFFKKSEGLAQSSGIPIDASAHNDSGPLGVSVRSPLLKGAQEFVAAAMATGIKLGDYNGRDRGGPSRDGIAAADHDQKRQTVEHVSRVPGRRGRESPEPQDHRRSDGELCVVLEGGPGHLRATGVEYRFATGDSADRDCGQGSDLERGSDRLAPSPYAVRRRAAEGA